MADVRALFRQQRAARRIEHPLANYTDSGKLLCSLCHEPVKSETLWESHLRSEKHRRLAHGSSEAAKRDGGKSQNGSRHESDPVTAIPSHRTSQKRKHSDDDDMESVGSAEQADSAAEDDERGALPRKRSRYEDVASSAGAPTTPKAGRAPPPLMTRRQSMTPSQGIELAIPSRPATPSSASTATPTPRSGNGPVSGPPLGRSPLIPQEDTMSNAAPPRQDSTSVAERDGLAESGKQRDLGSEATSAAPLSSGAVDESEWLRFEAEIANWAEEPGSTTLRPTHMSADAIISAPAMTAEQVAAAKGAEEAAAAAEAESKGHQRRTRAQVELEVDQDEAASAREAEFAVMEDLEARLKRLRERREALRAAPATIEGDANLVDSSAPKSVDAAQDAAQVMQAVGNEEEEDEDEEDEDEDWEAFRLRR